MPELTTTSDTSKYTPKYIPIADIIELIEVKGLNQVQAAKILGCDSSNISRRLKEIDYIPGYLKRYKDNRADLLAHHQIEILKHISHDKLKKTPAAQLATMYGIFYDKERLERGQSTENIAYADMVKVNDQINQRLKSFEEKHGIAPQDITDAEVVNEPEQP